MTDHRQLTRRAAWCFRIFAPAILEAGGDPAREDAALQQDGVSAAKTLYDATLRELDALERRTAVGALRRAHLLRETFDRAEQFDHVVGFA